MTTRSALLALLLATGVSPPVHAGNPGPSRPCEARLSRAQLGTAPRYAPFSGMPFVAPLEVEVADAVGCRLAIVARSALGGRLEGAAALDYQVRDAHGRVLMLDGGTRAAVDGSRLRADVQIAPGLAVPAGRYVDRLTVQLLDGERILDAREVELAVDVQSQASVSLAGASAAGFSKTFGAGLDFGTLVKGEEREAYLFVLANAAYALRFESMHRGRLRHVGDVAGGVDYTARLDGSVLDLSGAALVHGRGRWMSLPPYRLNVRIGEVDGQPAGQYRDVITVDVVLLQ